MRQQDYAQPLAVFCLALYLALEALSTHSVASAAITEAAAVVTLDCVTQPWKHGSVHVSVALQERSG